MAEQYEEWIVWMKAEKGLLPATIRLYTRTIQRFEIEVGEPSAAETEDIRDWLHSKAESSPSSFGNRVSALRCYFRFLVRTKQRIDDPTMGIDAPKRHKGLPKPVKDLPETLAKLDEIDRKANFWSGTPRPIGQSRAMAVVLCETGLRIHEAVQLNVPVPAPAQLQVHGKGAKDAMIPLTDKAREALDFLGGVWPIGARATQRRFEKAGFHPHQCRHWRGTSMAEAGADLGDIQHMLRHSPPATTLTYAAWSVDRVRDALSKVPA